MPTKKYTSYAQIDIELEILKLEKEIHYQKMTYSAQQAKETLMPKNIVTGILGSSVEILKGSYGGLLKIATPFILEKAFLFIKKQFINKNKKRG